ncbi:DUF3306 domain-containing protein [Azospirillum endophyticum]
MAERVEEEEGFLGRWSRLKREAQTEEPPAGPSMPEPVGEAPREAAAVLPAEAGEETPELPPLDSLDAGSDYTGFLSRDVPADLRRQALRKAWASDPVIAGFRGFAEYDWDYNAPGYGALRPTDDIARLLDAVLPDEKREEVVDAVVVVAEAENSPETTGPPTADGPEDLPIEERGEQTPDSASLPLTLKQALSDTATIPSPPRLTYQHISVDVRQVDPG